MKVPRVKGHPTDPERLFAAEWIRGAVLVLWALGLGTFIVCGATKFTNPVYTALTETFKYTNLIGGALIVGGLLGMVGVWGDWRYLTRASCIVCGGWHAMFFGWTVPANFGVFGTANMISLFALLVAVLYLVQLYVIWPHPTSSAIG